MPSALRRLNDETANRYRRTAMKRLLTVRALVFATGGLILVSGASADDAELIRSAESAAPPAVASGATIYSVDATGAMTTLREGSNGYWCMPDSPASPGPDPMCGDANSMEWAMAWIERKDPPPGKVGFMYMMAGGSDASNTDPYATGPADGASWIETGPHVMIVNAMDVMHGYPEGVEPDTAAPYVMWAGTPYAHLMIPMQ
jgi:hypothetical protein